MADSQILIDVVRCGFVEGHHRGSVVVMAADGAVKFALGDPKAPIFPRSCNKPLQAAAMVRCGLDLGGELLALAGASHSGEPFHLEGVRRILASAGLTESALQTPPDYPLDDEARIELIRSGAGKSSIAMNCSGKHAAMLATCVVNDWSIESYLSPEHPLQQQLSRTFEELTGEKVAAVAIDGCGAPLFATSLIGLARGFRALVLAEAGSAEREVADAFVGFPQFASGSRRDEAALLRAIPGAIGKAGAEACYALALPDGRAITLKVEDGGGRARPVVMAAILRRLGLDEEPGVDTDAVRATGAVPLLGGGIAVGELRAAF
ncbi:MAG: asparaginase [Nocardioidaceae bacterium]